MAQPHVTQPPDGLNGKERINRIEEDIRRVEGKVDALGLQLAEITGGIKALGKVGRLIAWLVAVPGAAYVIRSIIDLTVGTASTPQ